MWLPTLEAKLCRFRGSKILRQLLKFILRRKETVLMRVNRRTSQNRVLPSTRRLLHTKEASVPATDLDLIRHLA